MRSKTHSINIKYTRFLPNHTAVVRKNWNILQTKKNLQELFQKRPLRETKIEEK